MTDRGLSEVTTQLRALFALGVVGELSDEQLLGRFLGGRGEAAESAFAELVRRHGPMVLGACRRVLGDRHEAEDAFQATFLVLAPKAGAIADRRALVGWLLRVADRRPDGPATGPIAARRPLSGPRAGHRAGGGGPCRTPRGGRRRAREAPRAAPVAARPLRTSGLWRREAARRLRLPEGTLSSRLARGRDRLRDRLSRRGLAPAAAIAAVHRAGRCSATVPARLVTETVTAAIRFAAGPSPAAVLPAAALTLADGVLKAMTLSKVKIGVLAASALLATGTGVLGRFGGGFGGQYQSVRAQPAADQDRPPQIDLVQGRPAADEDRLQQLDAEARPRPGDDRGSAQGPGAPLRRQRRGDTLLAVRGGPPRGRTAIFRRQRLRPLPHDGPPRPSAGRNRELCRGLGRDGRHGGQRK